MSDQIFKERCLGYHTVPFEIPDEIVNAAKKVEGWMEQKGYKNWQFGGICDRRLAQAHNNIQPNKTKG